MYKILASGSAGNSILYHKFILVDCGVPFASLKPHIKDLKIVLLTHSHQDHINIGTIKKLSYERPTLRFACGEWMLPLLEVINNVDVLIPGKIYNYGLFKISPVVLYHDVPNCGYRIYKDNIKIIHATDTAHMKGISAKGYDLYMLESNYSEETVNDIIQHKQINGQFAHEKGSVNSHLSEEQAQDFFINNKGYHSKLIRLHESSSKL